VNAILLCHGGLRDLSSFTLEANQEVQYRGNFGTPLSSSVAKSLVSALVSDPTVTDSQLALQLSGYNAQSSLRGPNTFSPDIDLKGDDNLFCFFMNMANGRWLQLGSTWQSRLSVVVRNLGAPLWLNLCCCTTLRGADVPRTYVKDNLAVRSWENVL
jgi:hypothetical protein